MTVTFFGHRDAPTHTYELLKKTIIYLIEKHNADNFYVGNHGNFDSMALRALQELQVKYKHIRYAVVLAYMPSDNSNNKIYIPDFITTLMPDGIESAPPKYAITKRNKWMIENSDFVITYVKFSFGGAATFQNIAMKKEKTIINIYQKL